MTIFLWVLQILLALHTLMGAVWKFSNSAGQTMPSLGAIPHGVWLGMSGLEVLAALCLILPGFYKPLGGLVPLAAAVIAVEMLLFCGLHLRSGDTSYGPLVYWLAVAGFCGFLAYARFAIKPV